MQQLCFAVLQYFLNCLLNYSQVLITVLCNTSFSLIFFLQMESFMFLQTDGTEDISKMQCGISHMGNWKTPERPNIMNRILGHDPQGAMFPQQFGERSLTGYTPLDSPATQVRSAPLYFCKVCFLFELVHLEFTVGEGGVGSQLMMSLWLPWGTNPLCCYNGNSGSF